MKNLARWEKETVIIFNEEDEAAEIATYNPRLKRALKKCSDKNSSCYLKSTDEELEIYVCPKTWITVRTPRELSEESRQKLAERARARFGHTNGAEDEDVDDDNE